MGNCACLWVVHLCGCGSRVHWAAHACNLARGAPRGAAHAEGAHDRSGVTGTVRSCSCPREWEKEWEKEREREGVREGGREACLEGVHPAAACAWPANGSHMGPHVLEAHEYVCLHVPRMMCVCVCVCARVRARARMRMHVCLCPRSASLPVIWWLSAI